MANEEYLKGKRDLAKDLLQKHEEGHEITGDALDLIKAWAEEEE